MAGLLKFKSKEAREKVEAKELSKIMVNESLKPEVIRVAMPICHVSRPTRFTYCNDRDASRRNIVLLYAKLGIHRYNFLRGKDVQLSSITQFTKTLSSASAYRINLIAEDPESSGSLRIFQAQVHERCYNRFYLACTRYAPRVEAKKSIAVGETTRNKSIKDFMPELPPENPFQDADRFRVVKPLNLKKIRYIDMVVATTNRNHIKHGVPNLKILKVAMEITRDQKSFHKGLGAYDAVFYIRYKDSCKARVGDDVDRVAIVRRIVDMHSEIFRLVGHTQSSQTITPASNGIATINDAVSSSAQD